MNVLQHYQFVETVPELESLAELLLRRKCVAVDLEADSLHHFRERICLLQVASREVTAIIDPLSVSDLSSLGAVFSLSGIRKIFHGADYDIRSLHRDYGFEICNLFDTEIAARYAGYPQTGLDAVLNRQFGVSVNKKFQKRDWSMRPLPREMIAYAVEDAAHLAPLAVRLRERLIQLNRLHWVEEECELLSAVRPQPINQRPLFLRFKGAGRLDKRSLAVLESLLALRLRLAEQKDRPPFKVFGNAAVLALAKAKPTRAHALGAVRELSDKQRRMHGSDILEAVNAAMELPPETLPSYPRKRAPKMDSAVPERVKRIRAWRDARAHTLQLDPPLLMSKALMTAVAARNPRTLSELEGVQDIRCWQIGEFGEDLLRILKNGRQS